MKILMVDPFPEWMVNELQEFCEVNYQPDVHPAEVYGLMKDVEVLVMNSKVDADRKLTDSAPALKMICRAGVGLDHFDMDLMEEKGIHVVNTPGANAVAVAEQAVGMLIAIMHNIGRADRQIRELKWHREENRGTEIFGKTVGIIGYGNTGSAFAARLAGFGCRVLAFDKYKTGFGDELVEECQLEDIFENADILSIHIPLTGETNDWLSENFFDHFRKPIFFLNLSRGPIVNLYGLLSAVQKGKVRAAGLDVLENEKLHTLTSEQKAVLEALFETDKVIFTSHIGGWTHESLRRINEWLVREIRKFYNSLKS